jgi:ubiquinone biosynthesis protein
VRAALRRGRLGVRAAGIAGLVTVHLVRLAGRSVHRTVMRTGESQGTVIGRSLTELLEALGATFVKVGQVLSSRYDLLPTDVVLQLRRLQEDVTPFRQGALQPALEKGLGRSGTRAFVSIDPEPVASASVANVYQARLEDGRIVAVKVRRPRVARRMERDLAILRAMAGVFEHLPSLRVVPLTAIADEIGQAMRAQVDLIEEACNNRRFRANFVGVDGVVIPRLVDELCSESVLTMEYLEGLRRVDTLRAEEEEAARFALRGLHVLYKMIFVDGFIHVDMHPGNIFFRSGGEFVFLDLGLVAKLSDADRREFAQFFVAMATNDGRTCARIVSTTARSLSAAFDSAAFEAAMEQLIARHSGREARDFEVIRFAMELFDLQRKHGVCGSTNFTLVIVSLVVFEGIVKMILPSLDFQGEARAFLLAADPSLFPLAAPGYRQGRQ